jgi:hypothetical protein
MSETIRTTGKAVAVSAHNSMHPGDSDLRMLAEVEKWMAMIREINREQQSQPALQC